VGKPEQFSSETVKPDISKAELVRRLSAVLPAGSLLHETEDLKPFECDGLTAYRCVPLAVALPENETQICETLRICNEAHVPVVFRGAGTGLSGGALPYENGLLLGLSKLKRILEIDPAAPFPKPPPFTACTTHPTRPARSPARSAATSPRIPAACTASSTA
jgi:hypothetical protein